MVSVPDRITVLIVDDHSIVRQGIRAFLEDCRDVDVVGEAAAGDEAVALCAEHTPDVVLMDLAMPGMTGIDATQAVMQVNPRTKIIVLTSYQDDEHILPAIRAGAQSYLLKDVSPDELVEAIRKAFRGEVVLHPLIAAQVVRILKNDTERVDAISDLTQRETEVLQLIADGLTNSDIAAQLYVSEKTAKSHVSNILNKLQLADRTQAAVYAWRNGLKQPSK